MCDDIENLNSAGEATEFPVNRRDRRLETIRLLQDGILRD